MQYRNFTKDNIKVSALGFGCMRLPLLENGKPDEAESIRMIRYAIDNGLNYLDTAAPYHEGDSEKILGKALKDGYREKVMVATKFPMWDIHSADQADEIFERQLERLDMDSVDVYLLHNLQKAYWNKVSEFKLIDWLEKKKAEGRFRYFGFSFHDDIKLFKEIVDSYDWDVCQIQYNYVNETVQAGTEGLEYAASKGISVIIMEPLFGGVLASPPGALGEVWKKHGKNPVDFALRWLWDKKEVSLVLSGVSNMEQTVQNMEIADRSGVGTMSAEELNIIKEARETYEASMPIKCTKCRYCMPCPFGVDIPHCFELYNNAVAEAGHEFLGKVLYGSIPDVSKAANCTECGDCESKCPQGLPIREHLKTVDAYMTAK